MSESIPEVMMFMGYKVAGMTRDGLLEVIKYQKWELDCANGFCPDAPNINVEKVSINEAADTSPPMPKAKDPKLDISEAIIKLVEAEAELETCDGYPEKVERCKKALDAAIDERISSLPRKEVISIQQQRAADLINEAIAITREEYEVSLKKRSFSSCTCMLDNIKRLTDMIKGLEVYREQGKKDLRNKEGCRDDCTQCNIRCMYRREQCDV